MNEPPRTTRALSFPAVSLFHSWSWE
jgi:hypothetical protein